MFQEKCVKIPLRPNTLSLLIRLKMTNAEILQTVATIIREVLELPNLIVTHETSAVDVDEWDSMTHIQLIGAIEGKFKVRFALGELQALKNVNDMIELIQKKLNK